jgi:dTDP-glucose 4,6-dehydratase
MTKRVLITGASGFIGSNVLNYLLEKTDWTFVCLCSWRHRGNPLNVPRVKRVEVITHDLRGPIPELGHFDYILNLASESHVDRSITHPVTFVENNIRLMLSVLEYARDHQPNVFLQFSTDEVFGTPDDGPPGIFAPSNPYAASKAAQEMLAMAWHATYDVPILITNSNNVIGPNQDSEKFVPKIVDLISRGELVDIHTFGGHLGRRFYNPVNNVADAILFVLNGFYGYDRVSIPGGVEMNNLEVATLIAKILGRDLDYELVEVSDIRPGYDTAYQEADNLLFDLGWTPPETLEEGLQWITTFR